MKCIIPKPIRRIQTLGKKVEASDHFEWIRHHKRPRNDLYVPNANEAGPPFGELLGMRITLKQYPNGETKRIEDDQKTANLTVDDGDPDVWRGRTIFFVKKAPPPSPTLNLQPSSRKGPVRKIVEICSFTLMMTSVALTSLTGNWQAMTPISIEQGFDLLTVAGRNKADDYLHTEKPDLIVAEWMCDPFCQIQDVNIAKGCITAERILEKRQTHTKLVDWIAKQ